MHPTDVAGAAWVFATAPSKAPFYVAGGLLAGWAVLLAAFGISHADLPSSAAGSRLVMATTALLVGATITTAIITAGETTTGRGGAAPAAAAGSSGTSRVLQLAADPNGNLAYDKKQATVGSGTVAIRFVNKAALPHNVTIAKGGKVVGKTKTIAGATAAATASLVPGQYVFYCSVPGHRQAGMQGTLTVK
jgi:plastocyanin